MKRVPRLPRSREAVECRKSLMKLHHLGGGASPSRWVETRTWKEATAEHRLLSPAAAVDVGLLRRRVIRQSKQERVFMTVCSGNGAAIKQ